MSLWYSPRHLLEELYFIRWTFLPFILVPCLLLFLVFLSYCSWLVTTAFEPNIYCSFFHANYYPYVVLTLHAITLKMNLYFLHRKSMLFCCSWRIIHPHQHLKNFLLLWYSTFHQFFKQLMNFYLVSFIIVLLTSYV